MDNETNDLREKLQARRREMNSVLQTASETQNMIQEFDDDDDDDDDNIPILGDQVEEIDETEEEAASRLKEKIESRHDATRRRLQRTENSSPQRSLSPVKKQPRENATKSPGQSLEFPSNRSEGESTLGSTLGRSPGKSLRNRLQEKLLAAKEQRSAASMSEDRKRIQRMKDRMSAVTRFDDPLTTLGRSDLEKERELESKIAAKLKWKRAMQKTRGESGIPSEVDCYDFFTKQYEDKSPEPETEPAEQEQPEGEPLADQSLTQTEDQGTPRETPEDVQEATPEGDGEQQEEETTDDQKKLLADIIPPELDFKLFSIISAEYIGHRARVEQEQRISFVPSVMDAPAGSKMLEDATPVYLEEEGFYVGLMPEVQIRNRNILENRILGQEQLNHKTWFGPDGRVKVLPNPVRMHPTKPWVHGLSDIDPALETIYVKAYESSVEEKYLEGTEEHELQIDIGTIIFHHHPLMSKEHVLASRLSELYEAYIKHRQKNYAIFYEEKLRTLRLALKTMKRYVINDPDKENDEIDSLAKEELRIQDYLSEIRRTCNQRDKTELYERELIRKIINEWNEIKKLRSVQTFSNTSAKLTVKKQEVDQDADKKAWEMEIKQQLLECKEEHQYTIMHPYRKKMTQYQKDLQEWKKKQIQLKRQRKRAASLKKISETQEEEEENVLVGAFTKPLKPDSPIEFNEEETRQALIQQALKHRRQPGEAKVSVEVTNTSTVTPNFQVPGVEVTRRQALLKSSIIAQIKIDGKDVCSSEAKGITTDFQVHFGQIFKIFISQWPDTIKVVLKEVGLISNTFLGEIFLSVPEASVNSANAQSFPKEFRNERSIVYNNHEGVGSCTPFTLYSDANMTPVSIATRGSLFLSIAWGVTDDGRVLAPKLLTQRAGDPLDGARQRNNPDNNLGPYEVEIADLWSQEGKLDPNDPINAGLVAFGNAQEGFVPALDYFRLDQLQEQFDFVSDEDLSDARRLRVLEYRSKGIAEFRNLTMVPANEHEVLDAAFTAYERRKREKESLDVAGEKKVEDGLLSAHRLEVLRFRQNVRDSVLRRFYTARHYYTLQDMVIEEQVPDIGTLGISLMKTVEPRRPLRPVRTERKKATGQNLTEGSVKIIVSVVKAYNLPVREQKPQTLETNTLSRTVLGGTGALSQSTEEDYKLDPFVSVGFQGNVKATHVSQGPNPSWNEEIEIPFSAPNNDYTSENLQVVDDTLFIHVFDRVITDASVDNRDQNERGESSGAATGVVSHRIQNHWLWSLRIPFPTIYQRGKIEGTFKLNIPAIMLGYKSMKTENPLQRTETIEQTPTSLDPYLQLRNQVLQPTEGSYLSVFVTLEPELARPEPVSQKFETQELPKLIDMSMNFIQECKKKFPKRKVKTTVVSLDGESIFITRYVKPLNPPPSLLGGSGQPSLVTAERLARFVSLIPFVSDNVIYAGTCDLWSRCDQFLNMLCGDEEEHAVLLLNYFLHIGMTAFLVLGSAIPEGETAYVLTHDLGQEYLLWNASNGQHYKTSDSLCPMQSVYALINQDNIWFNMQTHDTPSRMNFNLNQRSWKALFKTSGLTQGLDSIQPDLLSYPDTDITFVQNLEEKIERKLKDAFMSWRTRHVTKWNRSCSSALRQILQGYETEKFGGAPSTEGNMENNHTERLKRLIGDARFTGFPMDMPYTDIDAVVKAVQSTEVHKTQDSNIEFALAVHIHPYPSSVLCVWVYLATIRGRRTS